MKCNYDKEQFFQLLTDQLDSGKRMELETHLATCPECQMEWEAAKKLWLLMGDVPAAEPSDAVRTGFSAILKNYKEEQAANKSPWLALVRKIQDLWIVHPAMQMGYSVVLLLAGLWLGHLFSSRAPSMTTASGDRIGDHIGDHIGKSRHQRTVRFAFRTDPGDETIHGHLAVGKPFRIRKDPRRQLYQRDRQGEQTSG